MLLEGGAITNPKPLCNLQHEQTYGLGREAPCAVGEKVFEVRAEQRQRHDVTPQHLLCARVPAHTVILFRGGWDAGRDVQERGKARVMLRVLNDAGLVL